MKGLRTTRRLHLPLAQLQDRGTAPAAPQLRELYRTLLQANQAMLRATSEADLFQNICRVCVDIGHFGLAWISVLKEGLPITAAAKGPMKGYLQGLQVSADPADPLGQGPTGRAFRGERQIVCHDWNEDARMAPWRERGAQFSIQSSASFPVRTQAGVEAVLTLYADRRELFQRDMVDLLEQLTRDMAFAMDKFREEGQRREAERRYQDLVTTLHMGIYRLRVSPVKNVTARTWEAIHLAHYQVEFASDRFYEISGVDRQAFQANPSVLLDRLHPEDREAFSERNAEALTQVIAFHWEGRLVGAGQPRWIRFESAPRRLPDGGTLWTGVLTDITARRVAENEMHRASELLRQVEAIAGVGGWELDLETQSLYWSEETYRIHDLEPGTYSPTVPTAIAFYAPESRPLIAHAVQEAIDKGQSFDLELEVITAKDRRIWIHTNGRVQHREGRAVEVLGAFQDITERKRMEREIRSLNRDLERRVEQRTRQLEATNQELESFAYSVSHDLRAPLRAIEGFAEALRRDAGSVHSRAALGHLDRVADGVARMSQLIEDLLQLSRIGRDDFLAIPLELGALAERVLAGLQSADPARQVTCQVQHPIQIMGDPRQLRILLENLLGNAWKFTALTPEASITVTAQVLNPGLAEISIQDNGVGFEASQVGKLFTPFQRLHSPAEFPGTGIGLAIAKRIVTRHGGMIRAEGARGQGAAVHFTLPTVTEGMA